MHTIIIYDCPKITSRDLEQLRLETSPRGVHIIDSNLTKIAEKKIGEMATAAMDSYSTELKRQIRAFKQQVKNYFSVRKILKTMHKQVYMDTTGKLHLWNPQDQANFWHKNEVYNKFEYKQLECKYLKLEALPEFQEYDAKLRA